MKPSNKKMGRRIAMVLAVLLCLSSLPTVAALTDLIGGKHGLSYSSEEIFEKLDAAVEAGAVAVLGETVLLPYESDEITADITAKLSGKYLIDAVTEEDGCVAYLVMDPDTCELLLFATAGSNEGHSFEVSFDENVAVDESVPVTEYNDVTASEEKPEEEKPEEQKPEEEKPEEQKPEEEKPGEEFPAPPTEETPAPPVEETPAPPVEETPAPPVEETPAPPVEETPAPPVEETPAPPVEETPAPPAEETPAAPTEEVTVSFLGADVMNIQTMSADLSVSTTSIEESPAVTTGTNKLTLAPAAGSTLVVGLSVTRAAVPAGGLRIKTEITGGTSSDTVSYHVKLAQKKTDKDGTGKNNERWTYEGKGGKAVENTENTEGVTVKLYDSATGNELSSFSKSLSFDGSEKKDRWYATATVTFTAPAGTTVNIAGLSNMGTYTITNTGTSTGVTVSTSNATDKVTFPSGGAIVTFSGSKAVVQKPILVRTVAPESIRTLKANLFDYDTNALNTYSGNNRGSVTKGNTVAFTGAAIHSGESLLSPSTDLGGNVGNIASGRWDEPVQGILSSTLNSNHLPVGAQGKYIADIFNPEGTIAAVTKHPDVDFELLYDSNTGYYTYDSNQNHAQYNNDSNIVELYTKTLGYVGQRKAGFLPYNDIIQATYDISTDRYISKNSQTTLHFGLSMEVPFKMPKDGQIKLSDGSRQDMIYEFSGDDDMWVYVDDTLVLDIGGIHASISGSINFRSGDVYVNGVYQSAASNFIQGLEDYSDHNLRIFYLERGANESNCMMRFNIPPVPTNAVSVSKEVANVNNSVANNMSYQFKLYTGTTAGAVNTLYTGTYTVDDNPEEKTATEGLITLKDGEAAYITGIAENVYYRFVEIVNRDTAYTTQVKHSGGDFVAGVADPDGLSSQIARVDTSRAVVFKNTYPTVEEPFQTLQLKKEGNNISGNFTFTVKLNDTLYTGDAKIGTTATSINNGRIDLAKDQILTIENLPVGTTFEITETGLNSSEYETPVFTASVADDNMIQNDNQVTGSLSNLQGGAHLVTCTNAKVRQKTEMTIRKTTESGTPIQGAVFGITGNSNVTTDNNGEAKFYIYEDVAEYTVTEVAAPRGYVLPSGSYKFTSAYDATNKVFTVAEDLQSSTSELAALSSLDAGTKTITVVNKPVTGSITITKQIDSWRAAHGSATFFFHLKGEDGVTYSKFVEFDSAEDVASGLSVTFDNLPVGPAGATYTVTESKPLRYAFGSITDNSANSTINGNKVIFSLTAEATDGEATFNNTKTYEEYFSHTDVVSNQFTIKRDK